MKTENAKTLFLASLIVFISCGTDSDESIQNTDCIIPEFHLAAIDSFGVEIGDSVNMIGSIVSFCHHPNGSVLILDNVAGCLRIIPENGEAFRVLRNGGGPGEFQGPQGVCALGDGRILIADYMKRNLMTYDDNGDYLGNYFPFSESDPPFEIWPVDSSSIVGVDFDGLTIEGELNSCYYCARYDSDVNPSVMYYLLNCDNVTSNEWTKILDVVEFYADRTGQAYVVEDFTEYCIDVYSADGLLDYQIEVPADRLQKSAEQIQTEIDEYEEFATHMASYSGGYQPPLYKQLISITGVDSDGNLWIERFDSDTGYHFDVWDTHGELTSTVSLASIKANLKLKFLVDEIGILGAVTDPDDFPRVYYFEKI